MIRIGLQLQSFINKLRPRTVYYVRPAGGGPYGTSDGLSYANAWAGDAEINRTLIAGNKLFFCGTHTEDFIFNVNDVVMESYGPDPFVLDATGILIGFQLTGGTKYVLKGLEINNATTSCLDIRGATTFKTYDLVLTNSGNQGAQHYGTCSGTHNNITSTDNVDDGVSGHDSSNISVNGGTFERNAAGVNFVQSSTCTMSGSFTWGTGLDANTTYDLQSSGADSDKSTTIIYNSSSPLQTECNAFSGGWIQMNGSIANPIVCNGNIVAASAGTGFLDLTAVIINGSLNVNSGGVANVTSSLVSTLSATGGKINYSKCRIRGASNYSDDVTLEYCLIDEGADIMIDTQSGASLSAKYCVFYNTGTDYGAATRTGSALDQLVNCTFVDTNNTSNGYFSNITTTIKNNIFTGLATGIRVVGAGVVVTGDYCCTFNNTTTSSGTGTYTQTNGQTTNPNLTAPASLDFSLGTGSSCLGTGVDLGASLEEGIESAEWGDGSTEVPEVTLGTQSANWNIGAYV